MSSDVIVSKEYDFKDLVLAFEKQIVDLGGLVGHACDESLMPLKHTFVDGAYIREIFMPAGTVLTSKIHKIQHPYFVMQGKCSVRTEDAIFHIEAPFHGITEPGTKRILIIHEDTIWITVHVTNEIDLDKIEEQIIAKTFDDIPIEYREVVKLKET